MDEMGTEPSQAGREAFGRAPRAGGSRRRAASRTAPGREGGSPSLASQVNPSRFWARALVGGSGKFAGSPRFRVFRLLAVAPPKRRRQVLPGLHIALKAASHLPFPALFSWREIAAPLL